MRLKDLRWTPDNPPGYAIDRYRSQWLVPATHSTVVGFDRDDGLLIAFSKDEEIPATGAYRVIKREPPHIRAGIWSVKHYSAIGADDPKWIRHYDALTVACFISVLEEGDVPRKSLWRHLLEWWQQ